MTAHGKGLAMILCAAGALTWSCARPAQETRARPLVYKPAAQQQEAATPAAEAAPAGEAPSGPLVVDVSKAVLLALENNPELALEQVNPAIRRTFEEEEAAAFDPVLSAGGSHERQRSGSGGDSAVVETNEGSAGASKLFPTGTGAALEASAEQVTSPGDSRFDAARVGLTVTQALLRGAGAGPNLASLRQARLDTLASEYELRGFAEGLVAAVEKAYWDYVLAKRQIEIYTESLSVAEQALGEIEERIRIGDLAEIELAAGQAEVALRREALINANGTRETSRLELLQLMNPPGPGMWDRSITPSQEPREPEGGFDEAADHVALALKMRPELNQARLAIQRDDLQIVKTRNGLLPRLDVFLTLGKTGYADSFRRSANNLDEDTYDIGAGLAFQYPLRNRAAMARHERATLNRAQAADALKNLERLVELDVRTAHIGVRQAAEQVTATAATRRLQEETLRGETEKFRVGKSTAFLVAQVQRDLLVGQIGEIRALVNYQKALVDLYRLDGSLLARRGIVAPGAEPPATSGEMLEGKRP